MNKYRYVEWHKNLRDKHGDNTTACTEEKDISYLSELLAHNTEQIIRATEAGANDYRWIELTKCVLAAGEALKTGNSSQAAITFYQLGLAVKDLQHPSREEKIDLYKARIESLQRNYPLELRNRRLQHLKELAQIYAQKLWREDTERKIRIGEMCKIVHKIITNSLTLKDVRELIPEETEGIKPWLREIAPEYTKKPGRSKKNKK